MTKFDAIVPCFNDGERIGNVLTALVESKFINTVFVVNDASSDNTAIILRQFPQIKIITFAVNKGKGDAVKAGLELVRTPAVFLFDADLSGLKEENIKRMFDLYILDPSSMVVGLREKSPYYIIHWLRENVLPLIAGERLLSTENLKDVMKNEKTSHYGLEPHMNHYFKINGKPIKKVLLKGVNDTPKWKKSTYGFTPQIQETIHITYRYADLYVNKVKNDIYFQNTRYRRFGNRVVNRLIRELTF